uniref:Uncharacterized protein n=1 Tax=Sphaerodactylus townsendi TaxID=933632 RepID=A0ACB8E641_9SAUR
MEGWRHNVPRRKRCPVPLLPSSSGAVEIQVPDDPVVTLFGHDATLRCSFAPDGNFSLADLSLIWQLTDTKRLVHKYADGRDQLANQGRSYANRTALFYDQLPGGNVSLLLRRVQIADEGSFTCFVRVRDYSSAAVALQVAAVYSKPNLSLEPNKNLKPGDPVTVTCHAFRDYPKPALMLWPGRRGATTSRESDHHPPPGGQRGGPLRRAERPPGGAGATEHLQLPGEEPAVGPGDPHVHHGHSQACYYEKKVAQIYKPVRNPQNKNAILAQSKSCEIDRTFESGEGQPLLPGTPVLLHVYAEPLPCGKAAIGESAGIIRALCPGMARERHCAISAQLAQHLVFPAVALWVSVGLAVCLLALLGALAYVCQKKIRQSCKEERENAGIEEQEDGEGPKTALQPLKNLEIKEDMGEEID